MYVAITAEVFEEAFDVAASKPQIRLVPSQTSQSLSPRNQSSEGTANMSYLDTVRNSRTPTSKNFDTTDSLVDFVKAQAIRYQQKELAAITGLSLQQVKNLRLGLSGIGGKALTNWNRNCPRFAAEYAEYVGIIRPGDAHMSEALTRFANAVVRKP